MSDVPPGVLVQILWQLPVKSLLRFRSVSKPWCALIDSPYFVNLHLNHSLKTPKNPTVILGGVNPSIPFLTVDLDSGQRVVELDIPFNCEGVVPRVLGSCNGLLCLSRGTSCMEILLWNPSTKKHRVIEAMPIEFSPGSTQSFFMDRIGYDSINYEYKVVRLFQSCGWDSNLVDSKVSVYSLKSNLWQTVEQDFPYHVCYLLGHGVLGSGAMAHGVSVGGAIHWVVTEKLGTMSYLIAAFDLGTHEFRLVPQPEYSGHNMAIDLGVLGGCLSVIGNQHMLCVDIWVMMNYGVKESWTKLISMIIFNIMTRPLPCVRPLAYSKNGEEVILELENKLLIRYHLEKQTYRRIRILGVPFSSAHVYEESLV